MTAKGLNCVDGVSDNFLTLPVMSDVAVCWNGIPKHKCSSECPYFIERVVVYKSSSAQMLLCKRDPAKVAEIRRRWRKLRGLDTLTEEPDRKYVYCDATTDISIPVASPVQHNLGLHDGGRQHAVAGQQLL